jgi:serine protease Do
MFEGRRATTVSILCLMLIASVARIAPADTFRLVDGKLVRGELLKERPDSFVVDLGFEVVVIPRKLVEEHLTDDQAAALGAPAGAPPAVTAPVPERPPAGALYSTSGPVASGVRGAAQKFGPAVVTVSTPSGLGSGFVIDEAGHVVTNAHVIHGETQISLTVFLLSKAAAAAKAVEAQPANAEGAGAPAGSETPLERRKVEQVRIVAIDPFLDLALLQAQELSTLGVPHVYLGDSDLVRVGQEVFAIGAPLGLERSVSQGIASSTERNLGGILYVQTTAAINPGNSGGPLFDIQGRVIGVINAKVFGAEGVGFAIPVFYLKHFLDHHEAFAYDKDNPNTGYHYLAPAGVISVEREGEPAAKPRVPANPTRAPGPKSE